MRVSPDIPPMRVMIAQEFDFTMNFSKARYSDSYTQLRKVHCGIKDQARAHGIGEISGLARHRARYFRGGNCRISIDQSSLSHVSSRQEGPPYVRVRPAAPGFNIHGVADWSMET